MPPTPTQSFILDEYPFFADITWQGEREYLVCRCHIFISLECLSANHINDVPDLHRYLVQYGIDATVPIDVTARLGQPDGRNYAEVYAVARPGARGMRDITGRLWLGVDESSDYTQYVREKGPVVSKSPTRKDAVQKGLRRLLDLGD